MLRLDAEGFRLMAVLHDSGRMDVLDPRVIGSKVKRTDPRPLIDFSQSFQARA
jgi:hypothetical protein